MGRTSLAISQIYLKRACINPITWFAFSATLFYSAFGTEIAALSLEHVGVRLSVFELMLYVYDNPLYLTWGIFLPFSLIICPIVYSEDLDLLVAPRADTRAKLWVARLSVVMCIAAPFLVGTYLVTTLISWSTASPVTAWSSDYVSVMRAVADNSVGTLPPVYYRLADTGYLYETFSPGPATLLQAVMLMLALALIGILCAALAQTIKRKGITLAIVSMWLLAGTLSSSAMSAILRFISPLVHVLAETRSAQFPYSISLVFFGVSLCVLYILGHWRARYSLLG